MNSNILKNESFLRGVFLKSYNAGLDDNLIEHWQFADTILNRLDTRIERDVARLVYSCGDFDRRHRKPSEVEKKRIHWILVGKEKAIDGGIAEVKRLLKKEAKEKSQRQNCFW